MASGFFALLDDIAMLMDDVSVSAKMAAKNTVGVLGDDLAVGAAKASAFPPSRELPVIWSITKGSFVNKLIVVPLMLLLNHYLPQLIVPILLFGALFLAYEGAHGIWGYLFPHESHESKEVQSEKQKIRSAIIIDFMLSIEIVLITLASVKESSLLIQATVVPLVALAATVGVYGIVALLVRLDDIGYAIASKTKKASFGHKFGMLLVNALPFIVKILSIVGIFAMLLVAGGILLHNVHTLHEIAKQNHFPTFVAELIIALLAGAVVMLLVDGPKAFIKMLKSH